LNNLIGGDNFDVGDNDGDATHEESSLWSHSPMVDRSMVRVVAMVVVMKVIVVIEAVLKLAVLKLAMVVVAVRKNTP
jgi:hypothetical protein